MPDPVGCLPLKQPTGVRPAHLKKSKSAHLAKTCQGICFHLAPEDPPRHHHPERQINRSPHSAPPVLRRSAHLAIRPTKLLSEAQCIAGRRPCKCSQRNNRTLPTCLQ